MAAPEAGYIGFATSNTWRGIFRSSLPTFRAPANSSSPEPPITAESVARPITEGIKTILGPDHRLRHRRFLDGRIGRGLCRLPMPAGRQSSLVLVSSSGTNLPRAEMEPLHSWRRLPTEAEKREAHRKNLSILMIHDPAKIDELALYVQAENSDALARARQARFEHRHARAKSGRLQGKTRRHLGRVRLHVGALYSRAQRRSCRSFSRDRRSQSFPMPDIGCNTRRMTPSTGCSMR